MPVIYHKKIRKDTELAVWRIDEAPEDLYRQLQLNEAEQAHYQSLNHNKRNMHWLGSRVLLRTLLNTSLYIDCQLDENNKPYLTNFPYEISITHSNELAAVIICRGQQVGIDIEKMSEKVERIATRFLSADELSMIRPQQRIEQLYVCWGVKESLFKLYGKGNLPFIGGIRIHDFSYSGKGVVSAEIDKDDYRQRFEVSYELIGEYMLTWVIAP